MNFPFRPTCVFIWHFFLPNPLPLEAVSQCHPEAVAEGSRICKELQSLDSSPAAQNDIRMIFTLRHSLRWGRVRVGVNDTATPAADELDTDFRKNPISDPNCATFYDLRSQAAAVDQSPHGPFNG